MISIQEIVNEEEQRRLAVLEEDKRRRKRAQKMIDERYEDEALNRLPDPRKTSWKPGRI